MIIQLVWALVLVVQGACALERITIPIGGYIDKIPGASMLKGSGASIEITLTNAEISGPNVTFRTPIYKQDSATSAFIFGPTLRVKAGGPLVSSVVQCHLAPNAIT